MIEKDKFFTVLTTTGGVELEIAFRASNVIRIVNHGEKSLIVFKDETNITCLESFKDVLYKVEDCT